MTIQQIDQLIEEGESLRLIAQSYSEIANLKIKRIRSEVLRNRTFFDEISKVYAIVKAFAIKKQVAVTKPKKRLCILLTSNYRFYGNINSMLIKYFIGSTRELQDVDKLILGKGGINFFRASKILSNQKEVTLNSDMPTYAELTDLVKVSSEYNQVLVFHSKFKSLLTQRVTFTDITATNLYSKEFLVKETNPGNREDFMQFIFEPELIKILLFFESSILTLLLEETFLESELSRAASRFISMDQAQTQSIKFIEDYSKLKTHAQKSIENNKILEAFTTLLAAKKVIHE